MANVIAIGTNRAVTVIWFGQSLDASFPTPIAQNVLAIVFSVKIADNGLSILFLNSLEAYLFECLI